MIAQFRKRLYGLIFIVNVIFISTLFPNNNREEEIRKAIKQELKLHPKATLIDLYKNFFQGRFGPGHMINNVEAASNYLKEELQSSTEFDSVLWQSVGYEDNYYRVNLSLVRDKKIDFEELLAAFTEKSDTSENIDIDKWKREWDSILEIIEKMNLSLPDFDEDKLQISDNLNKGIIIGHHSINFINNYHPHYRIVSKKHFLELYNKINR
jgi:hypothetical protein